MTIHQSDVSCQSTSTSKRKECQFKSTLSVQESPSIKRSLLRWMRRKYTGETRRRKRSIRRPRLRLDTDKKIRPKATSTLFWVAILAPMSLHYRTLQGMPQLKNWQESLTNMTKNALLLPDRNQELPTKAALQPSRARVRRGLHLTARPQTVSHTQVVECITSRLPLIHPRHTMAYHHLRNLTASAQSSGDGKKNTARTWNTSTKPNYQ
jgi:hypothetical protein